MFIKILSKYLVKIIIIFVTGIMLLSSFLIINEKRTVISSTIKQKMDHADGVARYMVNPL